MCDYWDLKSDLELIESILYLSDGFVWLKNECGEYQFCDKKWKKIFFGKEENFDIKGHTDIELLNEYRKNIHPIHDYGELCVSTDIHSNNLKKRCRYIEGGFIRNKLFILDVTKTPVLNDKNEVIGNIGLAIDRSNQITQVISEIETAAKLNILEQQTEYNYDGSPFVYWIKYCEDFKLIT